MSIMGLDGGEIFGINNTGANSKEGVSGDQDHIKEAADKLNDRIASIIEAHSANVGFPTSRRGGKRRKTYIEFFK